MIKLICKQCKKSFYVSPSRYGKIKCCSKKCSNLVKKKSMKGKNNPFYGKKHTIKTKEINRKFHLGQTTWNKGKTGIFSPEQIEKIRITRAKQIGEKHPAWKGGIRNYRGYIAIYSPNHPFKDKNNCVRKHRLIMEKYLNRFLKPEEKIHHINGIKTDNRLENLKLFPNNKLHIIFHGKNKPKKLSNNPKIL